jgi:hypothetical protein
MPTKNVRVLVFAPHKRDGEVWEISNTLDAMQAVVDGYIETVRVQVGEPWLAVMNEDGRLLDLPYNRCNLRGTFFVLREKRGEFVSLTDTDIKRLRSLMDQPLNDGGSDVPR